MRTASSGITIIPSPPPKAIRRGGFFVAGRICTRVQTTTIPRTKMIGVINPARKYIRAFGVPIIGNPILIKRLFYRLVTNSSPNTDATKTNSPPSRGNAPSTITSFVTRRISSITLVTRFGITSNTDFRTIGNTRR